MRTTFILGLACAAVFGSFFIGGRSVASAHEDRAFACSRACQDLRAQMWQWYHDSGAECIRSHEGSWHDAGAPYWGGFQADLSFQRAYGRGLRGGSYLAKWGTADHWPHFRQVHMAFQGYQARGWSPWPNTARACGLS